MLDRIITILFVILALLVECYIVYCAYLIDAIALSVIVCYLLYIDYKFIGAIWGD